MGYFKDEAIGSVDEGYYEWLEAQSKEKNTRSSAKKQERVGLQVFRSSDNEVVIIRGVSEPRSRELDNELLNGRYYAVHLEELEGDEVLEHWRPGAKE